MIIITIIIIIYKVRDDNGSSRVQIVPTRNPTHKKKSFITRPLPAGYSLKKYPRIFLKFAGTHEYPHTHEYLKNIYTL